MPNRRTRPDRLPTQPPDDLPAHRLRPLLEAIDRLGSIRRACAEVPLSYRHAWRLLRQAGDRLGSDLVATEVGGAAGGGARLTEAGCRLLAELRDRPILVASTIGPIETGLLPELERLYRTGTGRAVRHIAAGTGQALDIARQGRVDLVLAHAPALERQFIADGYGLRRVEVMSNDFLIAGPASDPAGISGGRGAAAAFARIAAAGAPFVSRGDRSGTHVKELELWESAGVRPGSPWYETYPLGGQGSAATLRHTDQRGAYTLVDRATYLTARESISARPLAQGDPALRNVFAALLLDPARLPQVDGAGANAFVEWLTGPDGRAAIAGFGVDRYGEPLFRPAP